MKLKSGFEEAKPAAGGEVLLEEVPEFDDRVGSVILLFDLDEEEE